MINGRFFSPFSIDLSHTYEYKCHVIKTNSDLQSLAAYCWAKKRPTIDIYVRMTELSQNVSIADNEFCRNILSCIDDQSVLMIKVESV